MKLSTPDAALMKSAQRRASRALSLMRLENLVFEWHSLYRRAGEWDDEADGKEMEFLLSLQEWANRHDFSMMLGKEGDL